MCCSGRNALARAEVLLVASLVDIALERQAGIGRILYFLLWIPLIFLEVWRECSVGEILLCWLPGSSVCEIGVFSRSSEMNTFSPFPKSSSVPRKNVGRVGEVGKVANGCAR